MPTSEINAASIKPANNIATISVLNMKAFRCPMPQTGHWTSFSLRFVGLTAYGYLKVLLIYDTMGHARYTRIRLHSTTNERL